MSKMTGKLAKQTVRETYSKACCRLGWITRNGIKEVFYEIWPSLTLYGGFRRRPPTILGTGPTKATAWIAAANKLIASMDVAK